MGASFVLSTKEWVLNHTLVCSHGARVFASSASQELPLTPARIASTLRGTLLIYPHSLGFSQKRGKTRQDEQSEVRS